MTTVITSIGLKGIEGYRVEVEVQIIPGKEGISVVGLPDASVKESRDRVAAALFAMKCDLPEKRIIINLSPSEQRKNSPFFDLAMGLAIMKEVGHFNNPIPKDTGFLGLLSLDGSIKPVEGMLPAILAAKREGLKRLYLPYSEELPTMLSGIELQFVSSIDEVFQSFSGQLSSLLTPTLPPRNHSSEKSFTKDFKDILGHKQAKRALEIAAAGGHHFLMTGPPGCGKSLLAETFPSILPSLSQEKQLEVLSIYQLAGITRSHFELSPFRSPHHSSSAVSLIGGGTNPKPGEISLAHRGILFLDEMAEFSKRTLDMLRQPLESGKVTISRATGTVTYPSRFLLVGAMNPCPCGHLNSNQQYCTCTPKQIQAYQNRVSGPILDRMDIQLHLQSIFLEKESSEGNETSFQIQRRVMEARRLQYERYQAEVCNATVSLERILESNPLTNSQQMMFRQWASKENWSNRVQVKLIRLARTIADLDGSPILTNEGLWEAMTLRKQQSKIIRKSAVR